MTISTPTSAEDELEVTIALGPDAPRLRGGRVASAQFGEPTGSLAAEVTEETWHDFLPARPRELPQEGIVLPIVTGAELRAVVTLPGGSRRPAFEPADLQGGRFDIQSAPGQGTALRILMPR